MIDLSAMDVFCACAIAGRQIASIASDEDIEMDSRTALCIAHALYGHSGDRFTPQVIDDRYMAHSARLICDAHIQSTGRVLRPQDAHTLLYGLRDAGVISLSSAR